MHSSTTPLRVRLLVADDSAYVCERLTILLESVPGFEVVGRAASAGEAIDLTGRLAPDLILIDYRMPGGGAVAVLEALHALAAPPVAVVLTNYHCEEYRLQSLALGAAAFLDKTRDSEHLPSLLASILQPRSRPALASGPFIGYERAVLAALAASSSDPFFIKDLDGRYTFANQALCTLVGRPLEEVLGRSDADLLPPDLAAACGAGDATARGGVASTVAETAGMNGDRRCYLTTKFPIPNDAGGIIAIGGLARDVTVRRQAEADLAEQVERFELMSRTVGEALFELSLDSRRQWWSEDMYRLFGIEPTQGPIGIREWRAGIHPDDRDRVLGGLDQAVVSGAAAWHDTFRQRRGDGTWIWLAARCAIRPGPDGAPRRIVGTLRDVTAQQDDAEARERMRTVIEGTTDAVLIADIEGTITFANGAAVRLLGLKTTDAMPDMASVHAPWARGGFSVTACTAALRDGSWSGESALVGPDGTETQVSEVVLIPRASSGRPSFIALIARDIGPIRALQQQLFAAEKLEVVGRLASGIAHDFNNILGAIQAFTSLLRDDIPADAVSAREDLTEIELAVDRAQGLTRQLLSFGRPAAAAPPRRLSVARAVADMEKFLARLAGDQVELTLAAAPEPCEVTMDLSQLQQVILNLVVNAREAMPEGGRLRIAVTCASVGAADAGGVQLVPGRYAVLTVTDTGPGLDPATLEHIFEPFFTTKPHGTGLGLANVYSIVSAAGGAIAVESRPGEGATFRIRLPAAAAEAA